MAKRKNMLTSYQDEDLLEIIYNTNKSSPEQVFTKKQYHCSNKHVKTQ
jgi:hypothetical protein